MMKKKWRVGFDDGSGKAAPGEFYEHGAYIVTKKDEVVVRGGTNEGIAIGAVTNEIAEHIVDLHNSWLANEKRRKQKARK